MKLIGQVAGRRLGLLGALMLLPVLMGAGSVQRHSHYLFVWAMEAKHPEATTVDTMSNTAPPSQMMSTMQDGMGLAKDFISVFDVGPDSHPFGKLVAMLPVGKAAMAHHTNYELPPDNKLYANVVALHSALW